MDKQIVDVIPGSAGMNYFSELATSQAGLTCFESVTLLLGGPNLHILFYPCFQLQNKAKKLFLTKEPLKLSLENGSI